MTKKIIQICLGTIPKHLEAFINSVIEYAKNNDWDYEQITNYNQYFETPNFQCSRDKFMFYRHCSDFIRTKYLSTYKNVMYVDWDIFLYPDFKIENLELPCFSNFFVDSIFYNGNNLNIFNDINKKLNKPTCTNNYNLSILVREYLKNNPKQQYFKNNYLHLDNCRNQNCYDLYK